MLFSDWSRSGQRDLRMTNDRHYYRDGTDQLWRVDPGETPRQYTEADGWRPMQIWGMGIASADLTGDGYPEVYLTSQGDNKLQTLADGPAQPAYEDIALERGPPPIGRSRAATCSRRRRGTPSSPTSTTTATSTCSSPRATSRRRPEYATRDPSNLLIGQADGTFVEGAEAAGIVSYERAAAAPSSTSTSTGCSTSSSSTAPSRSPCGATSARATPTRPSRWATGLAVRLRQPAPNVDAIGAWVEVRAGDRTTSARSPSAAVTPAGSSAGSTSGSATPSEAEVAFSGPTARPDRG